MGLLSKVLFYVGYIGFGGLGSRDSITRKEIDTRSIRFMIDIFSIIFNYNMVPMGDFDVTVSAKYMIATPPLM